MDGGAKLRLLYLARLLYEQTDEEHLLTTAQLMQALEKRWGISSHRQTIKADIETLRAFGLEIEEVKSTQNRYNLYGRCFDLPELKLLIDAVASAKFITESKSAELVEKLTTLTSAHNAARLKRNVSCRGRIRSDNERIYLIVDVINEAINAGRQISFPYFQYNDRKEKVLRRDGEPYVLTPLHLVWNGDCYYMIGVYEHKQRLGSFRVDRIAMRPRILDAPATPAPEGFDLNEYINTTFRMFDSEHEQVKLLCRNDVMDAIIDRFGEDVRARRVSDTAFAITVRVAASHIFYSWVFGFGGKVRILATEPVKQQYAQLLRAAVDALEE